jgi:uncharacterized Ntn-hydrolase superfamily protein
MTYSIVARDPQTGALGVAVETCMFAVGSIVPWAQAGVGAVATQAIAERAYGPRCLQAMGAGASASDALETAIAADPASFLRQVGVVSAAGDVGAMTGEWCIDHAGHLLGDGFAVQANMMASPAVWPAMAGGYTEATGTFPRRLLAALRAAQAAGGDARGQMSAAMLVVGAERMPDPWDGQLVSIRVERSADPLADLAALIDAAEAYDGFNRAVDTLMAGDPTTALARADDGLVLLPNEENIRFVRSGALAALGDSDAAGAEIRSLVAGRPSWETIIRSFASKGLMAMPPGVSIESILEPG